MRLEEIRGQRRRSGIAFTVTWNGEEISAYPGETVLGALIASGEHTLRRTRVYGEPRGMLCGIGVCYECLVTVDGRPHRRACMILAQPGMVVESGASVHLRGSGVGSDEGE